MFCFYTLSTYLLLILNLKLIGHSLWDQLTIYYKQKQGIKLFILYLSCMELNTDLPIQPIYWLDVPTLLFYYQQYFIPDYSELEHQLLIRLETLRNCEYAMYLKIQIIYNHIFTDIMINCSQKTLVSLLKKARQQNCYEKALAKASVEYQLKPYNVMKLQPEKILQIFRFIHKKFYNQLNDSGLDFWVENQLRIFVWVVVVYAFVEHKNIQEFNSFNYSVLGEIFSSKTPITLQFQSLCLLRHKKSKKWSQDETRLLQDSIKQRSQKNKWNQIAKQLFVNSNKKYFRTPKQCRQQWLNHLDPTKIKTQWTLIEDYQLIRSIIKNGRKWSKVAKQIGNHRTEHMVKNRFKSLINTEMKRLLDIDRQDILITKIRQRLQSHSSIKKFLAHQLQKIVKKQSEEAHIADPLPPLANLSSQSKILISSQHAMFSFPTFATMTSIKAQGVKKMNQACDQMEIEREQSLSMGCLLQQKRIKIKEAKIEYDWNLEQQPDIDELDIRQFFHSPQQNGQSVIGTQFFKDFD